jgi:hypothetical protein
MFSWENPEDRVAIVQMNAELRHAQLELLSAECATHQLRLRYSTEDIARFAERDVLHKAIATAGALNQYYSSIPKQLSTEAGSATATPQLNREQVLQVIASISDYLHQQRNYYYPLGASLSDHHRAMMQPFFPSGLLDRTRIVELSGARIANPPFYSEAKSGGFENLPDVQHMASITFLDVVVFNEKLTERELFHGLVHAVQFNILGVERYCDLFIRGFLRTKAHFTVPLETHAFALDSRFAQDPAQEFSVEGQVRLWMKEGRY